MTLEIRHLQLVQAILEEGGLGSAALRLHLSQPALSHQLRILEERLGTPLFHRLGRGLSPTSAGLQLGEAARRMLPEWASLERQLRWNDAGASGPLRLATGCFTGYHWLPAWMNRLQTRWPNLEIQLVPEATHDPIRAIREGGLDLAVLDWRPDLGGLHLEPLFQDPLAVILPRRHPLARLRRLQVHHLTRQRLFLPRTYEANHPLHRAAAAAGGALRVEVIPLTEAIVALVRGGAGWSLLPSWLATPHLGQDLVALPLGDPPLTRRWWAALPQTLTQAPWWQDAVQALRELNQEAGPAAPAGSKGRIRARREPGASMRRP